jgi:hypothetical protein
MSKKNEFIMLVLQVVSWIVFIGLCIETGALLFNFVFSLIKPTLKFYRDLDLWTVYKEHKFAYIGLFSFVIAISALKAYVFYLIVKVFTKFNLGKPFSFEVQNLMEKISYDAFSIAIVSLVAHQYVKSLNHKDINVGNVESYLSDIGSYLILACVVFVLAQVFKKGLELQSENDLTV